MRVIFDRSAFHGERFDGLLGSPLRKLVLQGRLTITHTPIFLDETISAFGSARAANEWQKHLAFAVEVCNGGVFLAKEEIWSNELQVGKGPFARHTLPERPNKRYDSRSRFLETLRAKAASGDLTKEWANSRAEREDTQTKKNNQRTISREVRQEVATSIKERRISGSLSEYSFAQFRKSEFLRTGKLLMDLVDARRSTTLADQWALNPHRYPFYSAFVDGFLYHGFYAAVEHSKGLDRNAQADYEQLAYLTWADIIVSNDQGFFKHAFDALWQSKGKRLMTSEEFVALTRRLA